MKKYIIPIIGVAIIAIIFTVSKQREIKVEDKQMEIKKIEKTKELELKKAEELKKVKEIEAEKEKHLKELEEQRKIKEKELELKKAKELKEAERIKAEKEKKLKELELKKKLEEKKLEEQRRMKELELKKAEEEMKAKKREEKKRYCENRYIELKRDFEEAKYKLLGITVDDNDALRGVKRVAEDLTIECKDINPEAFNSLIEKCIEQLK